MSVDVCLKQKGFFKKAISLSDITNGQFAYGTSESWILVPDKISNDMILYDPKHIARGISLVWDEKDSACLRLSLLLPTVREEVDMFYDIIARIAKLWKLKKYEQDGVEQKISDLADMRENIKIFSNECLRGFLAKHTDGCFFSALHPIYYDEQDLEEMQINFAAFLHHRQSRDLYYARPHIYQKTDGGYLGVYTLTNDVDSILPLEPIVPFHMRDAETNEELEVHEWYLSMYHYEEERFMGQLPYETAVKVLQLEEQERYDAKTRVLYGKSAEEMQSLIDAYGIAMKR